MPTNPINKKRKRTDHSNSYLHNEQFIDIIYQFYREMDNDPNAPFPNDLTQIILNMANRIAKMPCFSKYRQIEDWKQDSIYNCFSALRRKKFDSNKSNNPFSYFTSTIKYALLEKIKKDNQYIERQQILSNNIREEFKVNRQNV